MTVPANAAFDFGAGDSFSVEAWVRLPSALTCTPEPAIGRASPGVTQMQWWLGCDDGKAEFVLKDKQGDVATPQGTTLLTDGTFHYLVGVRDAAANEERLYVDGALEDTKVITYANGFDSASPIDIGWYKSIQTYHFVGDLDEVALYSRALSASEITQHHTDGLAHHGLCDDIVVLNLKLFLPLVMR